MLAFLRLILKFYLADTPHEQKLLFQQFGECGSEQSLFSHKTDSP